MGDLDNEGADSSQSVNNEEPVFQVELSYQPKAAPSGRHEQ